jgi:serine/threonine protein kinase
MTLSPGSRLGSYDIVAPLGAGGMGEVYRATDPNLGRQVAIKVLPEDVAADADRLARFQREAKTLASLNHPNIAQIYGLEKGDLSGAGQVGIRALVMELVEGPTLADRITQGPVPLDDALPIAGQIADALEAAHEQGIIHRDLKPANIKLRPDGVVKVLDFGLAKTVEPTGALSAGVTQSPTITSPALMTGAGVLLGTAAYMSPEQTKGRAADRRSDIWAFGCVLYEMLSGARPFEGEDINETIAAIRRASPDWTRLPADTPLSIRRLLRRCLEKDRRERLPDIGAARLDIKEAQANVDVDPAAPVAAASPSHRRLATLGWALASVMTVVALGLAGTMYRWPATPDTRVYRSSIVPHANLSGDPASRLAISPDGRRLAFLAPGGGNYTMVWVRALDGATAQSLAGTEGATHPFWSPDSRFIAFTAGGKLKKIEAAGGPALTICDSESFGRGTWNRDDIILFSPRRLGPIHRVHAGGGTPEPVMPLDANAGETAHRHPYFLPDGRHFLFTAYQAIVPAGLFVTSMDDTRRTRLMDGGSNAAYAQGFLLFLRDGTLLAQPFDAGTLTLTADARPVAEGVVTQPERAGTFSVSETGALVYQTSGVGDRQLAWTNRQGTVTGTVDSRRAGYQTVELSPDGTRAAASVIADTGDAEDIWVIDLTRSVPMRLTTDPASDRFPIWSPDGSHIVFQSNRRNGIFDLYQRPASGAGADEVLWADGEYKVPKGSGMGIREQEEGPPMVATLNLYKVAPQG